MRSFFMGLLFCLAMDMSLFAQQEDNVYVVHRAWKNYFSVNNHDLIYDKSNTGCWLKLGDFVKIEEVEIIPLPGGSYQERVLLTSLENQVSQYFNSRIINDTPKMKITAYAPRSDYTYRGIITLEDGSQYNIGWCWYDPNVVTPKAGDEVELKFDGYRFYIYREGGVPFTCDFKAILYRNQKPVYEFGADGPKRAPENPLPSGNSFVVKNIVGEKIWFKEFWPDLTFKIVTAGKREKGPVQYLGHKDNHLYFQYNDGSKLLVDPVYYPIPSKMGF